MMRMRRRVAAATAGLLLAAATATTAAADPAPRTMNGNHIDSTDSAGRVTRGRTSAGAVPLDRPAGWEEIPVDAVPTIVAEPVGGREYSMPRNVDGTTRYLCSTGINMQSSSGSPYTLSAGHCTSRVSSTTGVFYYPWDSWTQWGNRGARTTYNSDGDYGAIRANWTQKPSQVYSYSSGLFRTLTGAGNPYPNESTCEILAHSKRTVCGFIHSVDRCANLNDPFGTTVYVCNLGVMQSALADCPKSGDSGGPVLATYDGVGIISAVYTTALNCFTYFAMVGYAMSAYSLWLS